MCGCGCVCVCVCVQPLVHCSGLTRVFLACMGTCAWEEWASASLHSAKGGAVETGCSDLNGAMY